jgi:hypothetical protein
LLKGIHVEKAILGLQRRGEDEQFGRGLHTSAVPGEEGAPDGSLAEASLAATKYFEEAEKAAALYLENIKRVADRFAAEERQAGRPAPEKPAEEKNENPAEDDSVGPWNTEDTARAAEAKPAAEQKAEEPNEETAEAAEEAAEESQAEEFKEL